MQLNLMCRRSSLNQPKNKYVMKLCTILPLALTILLLSACTTAPTTPISNNPVVMQQSANSFSISVTGLPGKRPLDVERGFHEVADRACASSDGDWSGWKTQNNAVLNPVLAASGVYVLSGDIICSA